MAHTKRSFTRHEPLRYSKELLIEVMSLQNEVNIRGFLKPVPHLLAVSVISTPIISPNIKRWINGYMLLNSRKQ